MVRFEWDNPNRDHLKRHNVSPQEFEQAFATAIDLDYEEVDGEDRYHAIGMTNTGRLLYIIWTPRAGRIRAVTAFNAGPKAAKEWSKK